MINFGDLVNGFVVALRGIPELLAMFGAENIYAYHDRFPQSTNVRQSIQKMPANSIMVCWASSQPGNYNEGIAWKHRLIAYVKCTQPADSEVESMYYRATQLIASGRRPSDDLALMYSNILESCESMDVPSFGRVLAGDPAQPDYLQVNIAFNERGDN